MAVRELWERGQRPPPEGPATLSLLAMLRVKFRLDLLKPLRLSDQYCLTTTVVQVG